MEGEGSGYDLIYEIASRDSKQFPVIYSDFNTTTVTQYSKILDDEAVLIIDFISKITRYHKKNILYWGLWLAIKNTDNCLN